MRTAGYLGLMLLAGWAALPATAAPPDRAEFPDPGTATLGNITVSRSIHNGGGRLYLFYHVAGRTEGVNWTDDWLMREDAYSQPDTATILEGEQRLRIERTRIVDARHMQVVRDPDTSVVARSRPGQPVFTLGESDEFSLVVGDRQGDYSLRLYEAMQDARQPGTVTVTWQRDYPGDGHGSLVLRAGDRSAIGPYMVEVAAAHPRQGGTPASLSLRIIAAPT